MSKFLAKNGEFFFGKIKIVLRNKKMFKKQLEDLSLKNQPLMDKFVTVKPKLERIALPTPTHRNPFDDPGVRRESVKKPPKPPTLSPPLSDPVPHQCISL